MKKTMKTVETNTQIKTKKEESKDIILNKIQEEDDYIHCPRLGNSIEKLIDKNPDGVDDDRICKVLLIDKQELDRLFDSAILKLRNSLGVNR